MRKRVFFVIISIVVLPFCALLCTFGSAGIPEALSTMATVQVPADFNGDGKLKQLQKDRGTLQGCDASNSSISLLAHFHASPRRQRPDRAPHEVGEERPDAQKKPFLVSVDRAVFACSEAACDHYYRQCGLDIDYTLYSQAGTAVSEAVISCRAKIVYQTKTGYRLNSEAGPETSRHALINTAEYSSQLSLHFHFSEYEQVIEAQLDKIECRVHPGDYVSRVTEAFID